MAEPINEDPPDEEELPTVPEVLEELARLHLRTVALPLPRNPATFGWQVLAGGLAAFAARLLHHVNAMDAERGAAFAQFYRGPFGDGPHPLAVGRWMERAIAEPVGADMEQWAAEAEEAAEKALASSSSPAEVTNLGARLGDDVLSVLMSGLGASWKAWEEHGNPYRTCLVPGCTSHFNLVEAMDGKGGGEGWMQSTAVGYACAPHALQLWKGDLQHVPNWKSKADGASAELTCSCGWASGTVAFRAHGTVLYQAHALLYVGER
ncbi:hypothetical protein [Streptomyces sp. NPDC087297]|uniref:hypothetical protein n=1 Tax=Streptomyces sp. NPDC087297 TaxID=3365778 RepID=UPI0037F1E4F3